MYFNVREINQMNIALAALLCCLSATASENQNVLDHSSDGSRAFLTRLSLQDTVLWRTEMSTSDTLFVQTPEVTDNFVLVCGTFSGDLKLGNLFLESVGPQDVFYAIYHAEKGNLLSVGQLGGHTSTYDSAFVNSGGRWSLSFSFEGAHLKLPLNLPTQTAPGVHTYSFKVGNETLELKTIQVPQLMIFERDFEAGRIEMHATSGSTTPPPPTDGDEDNTGG